MDGTCEPRKGPREAPRSIEMALASRERRRRENGVRHGETGDGICEPRDREEM